ncbi:hypothetical protein ACN28S_21875 [Cystobacter fuscus]
MMGLGPVDGEALALGTLRPPPDSYCRVHLVFAPADADAEGLGEHPDMEGKTLVLEERIAADGGPPCPSTWRRATSSTPRCPWRAHPVARVPGGEPYPAPAYDRWLDGVSSVAGEARPPTGSCATCRAPCHSSPEPVGGRSRRAARVQSAWARDVGP